MPVKSNRFARRFACSSTLVGIALAASAGCSGRASLLPNSDPNLRKTSTEFAVDASKRFPFKADAPSGGNADGRAEVGYMLKRMDIENLSDEPWTNVEIWINQQFVVFLPNMAPKQLKEIPFQMFYDAEGRYFPTSSANGQSIVKTVNIYRGGKMYDMPLQMAE